jgi:hypothetical protein
MALSALVGVSALVMIAGALELGGASELMAAWGFGGAVLFAAIAVAGIHLWS